VVEFELGLRIVTAHTKDEIFFVIIQENSFSPDGNDICLKDVVRIPYPGGGCRQRTSPASVEHGTHHLRVIPAVALSGLVMAML
jgi:hypothetical protein